MKFGTDLCAVLSVFRRGMRRKGLFFFFSVGKNLARIGHKPLIPRLKVNAHAIHESKIAVTPQERRSRKRIDGIKMKRLHGWREWSTPFYKFFSEDVTFCFPLESRFPQATPTEPLPWHRDPWVKLIKPGLCNGVSEWWRSGFDLAEDGFHPGALFAG